jgi:hypothetical protein
MSNETVGWSAQLRRPATWHVITLVLSAALLVVAARNLWFYFDEWAFLVPSSPALLLQPHVGHWSTTPILVTHALEALFGLRSYWPYIILSMTVHLAICHLLWRIMKRVGVNAWIATALSFLLMVLGAGAENILWAFQFGFMGAMLLGLIVVVLVDNDAFGRARWIAVVVLSVWSLTFSGTAIPLIFAAGLIGLRRRGWMRTVALFAPAGVIYVVWYLAFNRGRSGSYGPGGLGGIGIGVPQYVGHEFVDGLGTVLPFAGFGAIAVFALVVWAILTMKAWKGLATAAYALACAAIVQAVLTAFTREGLGIAAASSGRYIYAIVSLLLPAVGLALTWFCRGQRSVAVVMVILILFTAGYNATLLLKAATVSGALDTGTRERISAALTLQNRYPGRYAPGIIPEPITAPDLSMGGLAQLQKNGWISPGTFDTSALLSVRANLDLTISQVDAAPAGARCSSAPGPMSASTTDGKSATYVFSRSATSAAVYLSEGRSTGDKRPITLAAGWTKIASNTGARLHVTSAHSFTFCGG